MSRPGRDEDPERLYTLTAGRTRVDGHRFDLVTLVVATEEPTPGMQSEHAAILRMCRRPTAVVEVAAGLRVPVSIAKVLLSDLLDEGGIDARHPRVPPAPAESVDPTTLEKLLLGLHSL